jgi:predicted ATPase/DNA-binding SARP family transcriptional activator
MDRLADVCSVSPGAIRTTTTRLRRLIGAATIDTTDNGYVLRHTGLDADEFERLVAVARAGDGHAAVAAFDAALALWRGNALAEFASEDWARPTAVRLEEIRAGAFEDRAEVLIGLGEHVRAVAELTVHIAAFPLRDRARGLLMRSLAAQGRRTEALRAYQTYRRFLADEVGVEPSDTLCELDRRISSGWRDDVPVIPTPVAAPSARPPTNLPTSPSTFVGRTREIAELRGQMDAHQLITIFGTGGVGKTRLALETAATADWAVDGTWIVELGMLRDGAGVPGAVAAILRADQQSGETLESSIVRWCTANRALIVLDNCEHVLDDVARLVSAILAGRPMSRLLATSREPLMVDGERIVALGPLALLGGPDGDSEAVQLLVDRAQDEASQLDLLGDRQALVEICHRLDGIPLAIELAASRMRSLSAAEIVERLHDRFRLLTGGRRTATERQKTLRATVEWSYQLLDEAQRSCFERLAVFAGTFNVADAVAVVGPDADDWPVVDQLSALVDRSLVVQSPDHRYRLLETLRSFGEERAVARGIAGETQRAHARWFRAKSSAALDSVCGPREVAVAHELLEQLPDYDLAMTTAFEDGDAASAIEIAQNLYHALMRTEMGPMSGMSAISRLLAELRWDDPNLGWPEPLPAATVVRALEFGTGWMLAMRGDRQTARRLAARAIRIDPTSSFAHGFTSRIASIEGEVDQALQHAEVAVQHAVDPVRRLLASLYLGYALAAADRVGEARQVAAEFAEWTDQSEWPVGLAWAHLLAGTIERRVRPQVALRNLADGAKLASDIGAPVALHFIQRQRIALLIDVSLRDASDVLGEVLTRARMTGDRGNLPMFLADAVTILHRLGVPETAARISGHVEVTAIDPDEALQLNRTVAELQVALGSRFKSVVRESELTSINDLLALAITALERGSDDP